MIRIVNLRDYELRENEVLVRVDRKSVLGNVFVMKDKSDRERDRVCDEYEKYFERMRVENEEFRRELGRIWKLSKKMDVALGCWCWPKRCHSMVIKEFIERYL